MKNDPRLTARARELRQNMTPAERILWKALRSRQFAGYKFRRQQPFGVFILDFYCSNTRLVLEIDGETHLGREQPDQRRSAWLESQDIKVLRIWNTQVYDELDAVLEMVFRECEERKNRRFERSETDAEED